MFRFIYKLEKRFWGEQTNPNYYIGSISVLFALCSGAYLSGCTLLGDIFNTYMPHSTMSAAISLIILFIAVNIAESIIVAESVKVSILRSLLLSVFIAGGFVVGFIGAIVVIVIVILIALLYFFGAMLSEMFGLNSKGKVVLEDGTVLTKGKDLLGFTVYRDSIGREYEKRGGGFVEK